MLTVQDEKTHKPVLLGEVKKAFGLEYAHLNFQARYIDATVGFGGHAKEIVKAGGFVLGIDADRNALEATERKLKKACLTPENSRTCFKLVHGNFINIDKIAKEFGFLDFDGILFDLGVSLPQLTSKLLGMSFREKGAFLDMRIDSEAQSVKASDLLNLLRKDQLGKLFTEVLDKKYANKIAKRIVEFRKIKSIVTVGDFLAIIDFLPKKSKIDPATRAFLALRIAVNSELENLKIVLPKAFKLLKKGGRLVVISFHSGEDAIVKDFFKKESCNALIIDKKPIVASAKEVNDNPRARSAKMRILEKK